MDSFNLNEDVRTLTKTVNNIVKRQDEFDRILNSLVQEGEANAEDPRAVRRVFSNIQQEINSVIPNTMIKLEEIEEKEDEIGQLKAEIERKDKELADMKNSMMDFLEKATEELKKATVEAKSSKDEADKTLLEFKQHISVLNASLTSIQFDLSNLQ